MCDNSAWTCFCGDNFSRQHGELICSQLGFPGLYRYSTGPSNCSSGATTLRCPDDATTTQDCTYTISATSCSQVYIECYSKFTSSYCGYMLIKLFVAESPVNGTLPPQNTYQVRLVDGFSEYDGRVELLANKQWGTICDNGFGITDANVSHTSYNKRQFIV